MKLKLIRSVDNGKATLGTLSIDNNFRCFILEDEHRDVKLKGETRIPAGTYKITLRTEGTWNERMKKHSNITIRDIHKGMLWLRDVPNFEYILIHPGNSEKDTAGCLLPGYSATIDPAISITSSTVAYIDLYRLCIKAFEAGEEVEIEIIDN